MVQLPDIPPRRGAKRRDRHGRGLRGPLLSPQLPGWRTRSERFDLLVAATAAHLSAHNPGLRNVEYGVEEIPPSDPSPWEPQGVVLGRTFPADRAAGVPARIVVYRRPILTRTANKQDLAAMVRYIIAEQAAELLGVQPWDIVPDYPED